MGHDYSFDHTNPAHRKIECAQVSRQPHPELPYLANLCWLPQFTGVLHSHTRRRVPSVPTGAEVFHTQPLCSSQLKVYLQRTLCTQTERARCDTRTQAVERCVRAVTQYLVALLHEKFCVLPRPCGRSHGGEGRSRAEAGGCGWS
jgi:hypothetical protein